GKFPTKFIEEDFRILRENRIEGITFLALMEEKLERYGMKGGPVNVIVDYIEKLKASKVEDSQSLKGSGEGADGLATIPDEHLACFDAWMSENPVGLLQSPLFSGKTMLIELLTEAGISWSSCVNTEVQTDILVDEAQILYRHAPWFWSCLKILIQGKNSLMCVLLVSMYGELSGNCVGTPITFP
ncbi:3725_t:CDS:2, partial [Paraglomus brasilianum]